MVLADPSLHIAQALPYMTRFIVVALLLDVE
jgi:hypothetical protein